MKDRNWGVFGRPRDYIALWTVAILVGLAMGLSGCSTLPGYESTGASRAESVWLAMDGIDTAQTVTIARSPTCWNEGNPMAVTMYGSATPSPQRVVITNAALGTLHYYAGGWIDRHTEAAIREESDTRGAWYVGRIAFYGVSLFGTGWAITHNQGYGIKPMSKKTC